MDFVNLRCYLEFLVEFVVLENEFFFVEIVGINFWIFYYFWLVVFNGGIIFCWKVIDYVCDEFCFLKEILGNLVFFYDFYMIFVKFFGIIVGVLKVEFGVLFVLKCCEIFFFVCYIKVVVYLYFGFDVFLVILLIDKGGMLLYCFMLVFGVVELLVYLFD